MTESEKVTRKKRIDTQLEKLGCQIVPCQPRANFSKVSAHGATAFAAFETPSGLKLNKEYELHSQRFRKEDLDENEKIRCQSPAERIPDGACHFSS